MQKFTMKKVSRRMAIAAFFGLISVAGIAQEPLKGPVVLEVSGDISAINTDGKTLFDVQKLEALGLHEIITETPWTEGFIRFEGVLGRELLTNVGATGTSIRATAINDYAVDIPISDFDGYDVIFATRIDGEIMSVRNRGPIWIIYPWTSFSEIQNEVFYSRSIWQLKSIVINQD